MVILSTSDTEHGMCFIDTCNIDGETNLKTMNALECTKMVTSLTDVSKVSATIECENPNPSLYTFSGSLDTNHSDAKVSINVSNVLLRGCILRQTKQVFGVVIFTGHDTKLMKNAASAPFKVSYLMKTMNRCLFLVFAFQALICATNTVMSKQFMDKYGKDMVYATAPVIRENEKFRDYNFNEDLELGIGFEVETWLTFIVAYSNLIPISLYVALEVVKLFQVVLIDNDIEMYHPATDTPTNARTSNLVEELGQVKFIFSDKTGTLTCNVMEFACASIRGKKYHTVGNYENSTFIDDSVFKKLSQSSDEEDKKDFECNHMFWKLLAVCHNVLPEYPDDDEGNLDKVKYQASSPDEAALVMAANKMGYQFCKGTPVLYQVVNKLTGENEQWEILATIEFNSTRKRMSIIARSPEGKILLLTKGADNIIIERLKKEGSHLSDLDTTNQHLSDFAEVGLRTLCLAYREISQSEYDKFASDWHKASVALTARDELQEAIAEDFERDLTLIGATAIEDKLQDGVPEAIETLAEAGIKLWVLTGDKQETAINIGFSCKLLTQDMSIHILSGCGTVAELKQHIMLVLMNDVDGGASPATRHAIVIDGATLTLALNEEVRNEFLEFGLLCDVCVCCRVSPKQKAEVVKLVKDNLTNPPVITLAIGDGANDVSMIQAAHIGIGISGLEGMQAVRASDFSVGQFRFLVRLLLVHGSWAYKRIAKFILFYFYKNMANVLTEYFFAFQAAFSGQILFADWLALGYNALYSSFGCIFGFCLDQDVSAKTILSQPRAYEFSMYGMGFDMKQFANWMMIALLHASICYYIPMFFMNTAIDDKGMVFGHWFHGTTSFICLIFVLHCRMALMVYSWNYMVKLAIVISISFFLITFCILCTKFMSTDPLAWQEEMLGMFVLLFSNPKMYLCVLVTMVAAVIPDIVGKFVTSNYFPLPHNILHEREVGWTEEGWKKPKDKNNQVTPKD